ncbi:LigB family dioxygenase [mine drainage metagenome]|uniref:LigB family dioxygenase n=1 Tax=mine drainage metagenome TaxID=410659 RepID=A0A1J5R0R6_9ZZZZ
MSNHANLPRLPTLFVPHGAPTFALRSGEAGEALLGFALRIGRPRAVLIVSAHWETRVPTLGIATRPETLHDFYGFPRPLYAIRYPAPGAVALAMEARLLLEQAGFEVALDPRRGLDHGAWIPLRLMFPEATVPVLTLSVQSHLGPAHHYRVGQALASLADAGVLVVGSGNLTHNLGHFHQLRGAESAPDYVPAFQSWVRERLEGGDVAALLEYRHLAPDALQAHPSDEHLLPFYVALGAAGTEFATEAVYSGIEHNMLAMDSYAFWPAALNHH